MKRRIFIFALCILAVMILTRHARAETISWSLPTTYTDGSAISSGAGATITTKLYKSLDHITWGTAIATVLNGATSWSGNLNVAPGGTIYVTATATIPAENVESGYAPYYTYTVAYLAPSTPHSITITRP
ncbi:MAG: hypothetical protein M0Z38_06680 [Deltaproteobacteria bacterium]|nr:hypothetical protein [Deltaproteobacteria bacterium]